MGITGLYIKFLKRNYYCHSESWSQKKYLRLICEFIFLVTHKITDEMIL